MRTPRCSRLFLLVPPTGIERYIYRRESFGRFPLSSQCDHGRAPQPPPEGYNLAASYPTGELFYPVPATYSVPEHQFPGSVPAVSQPQRRFLSGCLPPIDAQYETLEEVGDALRKAGLESTNLIIGIDFTNSNEWTGKHSFYGRSLHRIGDRPNPYEKAISIIGRTLSTFDNDNLISCYGFGDELPHDQDVFSFYPDERPCKNFEEALRRYRELVPRLRLGAAPTSYAPIIEKATTIVEELGGQYHVLLIISAGQVTRSVDTNAGRLSAQERMTIEAIQKASELPLSIVFVGVGDGPWDMVTKFDDNIPNRLLGKLKFVNFTEIMSNNLPQQRKEAEFALRALMDVPLQYRVTLQCDIYGGINGEKIYPRIQLVFQDEVKKPLYTSFIVERKNSQPGDTGLRIAICCNNEIITQGPLASAEIEVLVLPSDFCMNGTHNWSREDFQNAILQNRVNKLPVLLGNRTVKLKNGEATLDWLQFGDNSSWTRDKMFRIGIRVLNREGERVKEGVTESFPVRDRRMEACKKHYPPGPSDEVWRLKGIAKKEDRCRSLNLNNIYTVKDLLDYCSRDEPGLRKILGGISKTSRIWKTIIGHAKTCADLGDYSGSLDQSNQLSEIGAMNPNMGPIYLDCPVSNNTNLVSLPKEVPHGRIWNDDQSFLSSETLAHRPGGTAPLQTSGRPLTVGAGSSLPNPCEMNSINSVLEAGNALNVMDDLDSMFANFESTTSSNLSH